MDALKYIKPANPITIYGEAAAIAKNQPSAGHLMATRVLPAAAGAGAGYWYGKKHHHKWLGLLGGMAVGGSIVPLVSGENRADAIVHMGAAGAGVVASLRWKKHPAWGYILGSVGGSIVGKVIEGVVTKK